MAGEAHPYRIDIRPGLRLRAWRGEDLPALLGHADHAEVARGLGERFPHPYRRADGEAFLRGEVVALQDAFAIESQGEAVGGIGLRRMAGERAIGAEFGYWLGRSLWGRGLMSEAVAAFAPWALAHYRLRRLQATVLDFNAGSARVLRKNGFVEEGVLRHAVMKDGQVRDLRMFARYAGA
ncbi:N-acetyltransferase [Lysobacter pythonis]|uniref:N-acetyltransferase n=1 Tax=Solilutibacter pythonis TaxID=2483112 RepID=A0A3M2HXX4_9GAMM|nr:GNAT family N-acetyltransferase [Lysobacter pythonis]RMH91027.1 N-acetyltransferase [Lysobacter pythonis]